MSLNIKEILEDSHQPNRHRSRRNGVRDSSLVFIWSALEFLKSNAAFLNTNGFQKINDRSITFLENAEDQFIEGVIDSIQINQGVSKWLVVLIAQESDYVLMLRHAINYQYKKIVEDSVGDLFVDTLLEGPFFEWAQKASEEKKAYRQATKNVIEDYINVRQKASESTTVNSKASRESFKCFLSQNRIEALHRHLIDSRFIAASVPLDIFRKVFDSSTDKLKEPVLWLKKTVSLVYIFFVLDEKKALIGRRWQTLLGEKKQAFKNKDGIITTSNFSSVSRNVRKSVNAGKRIMLQEELDEIIDEVLSVKS